MIVRARLQKILSRSGVASRRRAEEMIRDGRVTLNGERVTEMGLVADPAVDTVCVDGRPLRVAAPTRVLAVYKPRGMVTTLSDPQGRPTIAELLPRGERLFPVGRLDFHSEGLLLLTNDGDLAYGILRPGSGVTKTYHVKVRGVPGASELARFARGLPLEGRRTLPARVKLLRSTREGNAWIEVVLQEGRRNQIRRMFQMLGHPVQRLRRVRVGPIDLGDLKPGSRRELTPSEVARIAAVRRDPGRGPEVRPRRRRPSVGRSTG